MANFAKHIKEWQAAGIINAEQAKKIAAYEDDKPENSWLISGLLFLGCCIVGIGVISLIAANWERISPAIKLINDFILLALLAVGIFRAWKVKKTILFEVLVLGYLILCLATIGLISQVFHTSGEFYEALMLWAMITAPLAAFASKNAFIPFMWTTGFLAGVFFITIDSEFFRNVFLDNHVAILLATVFLCAGMALISLNIVGNMGVTRALNAWTVMLALFTTCVIEIDAFHWVGAQRIASGLLILDVMAVIVALIILQTRGFRLIQKVLLLISLFLLFLEFNLSSQGLTSTSLAYAVCTILMLGSFTIFLAGLKMRRLFQCFLVIIGLRFLILYFEALGGLATTGFGLIIAGALVVGMAVAWGKYRKPITSWVEGLTR